MVLRDCDAAALPLRQLLLPVAHLMELLEHADEVKAIDHVAAEAIRVFARRVRELVDEALVEEAVLRAADRTPEVDGQMRVLHHAADIEVRNLVGGVRDAIDWLAFEPVVGRSPERAVDRADRDARIYDLRRAVGSQSGTEFRRRLRAIT